MEFKRYIFSNDIGVDVIETPLFTFVMCNENNDEEVFTLEEFLNKFNKSEREEIKFKLFYTGYSVLDVSEFEENNIEFKNNLSEFGNQTNIFPYLAIYEKDKTNIIKHMDIYVSKKIIFRKTEYDTDYFTKNFFSLNYYFSSIGKISMDNWLILDKNYVYGVEDNKIKLKIKDNFFYIDNLFLKFQKIYFNKKRFFNDDYDKLFGEVINYLNEYNKNIKIEKINSLENYIVNATVTLTIENIDKDFYFTEEPFEIEVPYDFDSFIKSKTIIKILKGRIGNHYKIWEGNIYKFEIEYNGRKEILYL